MTARGDAYSELHVPDMDRRIADMVRVGTVSELDYSDKRAPRVKVKYGKNTTGWIPWAAVRAGRARTWEPLKVGEQVLIASPSGDLAQGVIVGSINYNDREAPASGAHETVTEWDGGIKQSVDDDANTYTLEVPAGGKITLKCGGTTLELSNDETKLTTPLFTVDSPDSVFTGKVLVKKLLSFIGGLFGTNSSGATATIKGNIEHDEGYLRSNGVTVHTHTHHGVQPGSGNTAQPNGGT